MASTKSKGPKISNPAKPKGKSRANEPKPAPATIPKVKKADKKPPGKKADKNPPTKKITRADAKAGSPSTSKRSSPATLFEDDEELLMHRPLKKRKPLPPPTPEPEPKGSVVEKELSPFSSPSPSPLRKHHTPVATSQIEVSHCLFPPLQHYCDSTIQEEASDVENEVLAEAEDREDDVKVDDDIDNHGGGNNARPEDEEDEAQIEDQDQDGAEGEEDEDEDEDGLDQFQDPEATAYALVAALGFTTEAEK